MAHVPKITNARVFTEHICSANASDLNCNREGASPTWGADDYPKPGRRQALMHGFLLIAAMEISMRMMDWNGYRRQIVSGVGGLAKLSPDTVRGYGLLGSAGEKTSHFDAKTRELIALAVAVSLRCDGCITVHAEAARKAGAHEGEIAEALGVAISVNAGAALVYSTRTMDAFAAAIEA